MNRETSYTIHKRTPQINPIHITIDPVRTGRNLKTQAQKHGYTVRDIQACLGLSCPQPVYRWYKGDILPTVDHLLTLSRLFHTHMEDLLINENASGESRILLIQPIESHRSRRLLSEYIKKCT